MWQDFFFNFDYKISTINQEYYTFVLKTLCVNN